MNAPLKVLTKYVSQGKHISKPKMLSLQLAIPSGIINFPSKFVWGPRGKPWAKTLSTPPQTEPDSDSQILEGAASTCSGATLTDELLES